MLKLCTIRQGRWSLLSALSQVPKNETLGVLIITSIFSRWHNIRLVTRSEAIKTQERAISVIPEASGNDDSLPHMKRLCAHIKPHWTRKATTRPTSNTATTTQFNSWKEQVQ